MNKNKLSKNISLKAFIDYWNENVAIYKYSPVTIAKNNSIIQKRIIPFLGNYKIKELLPILIKDFFNKQSTSQTIFKYQSNHYISIGTIKRIKAVLSSILKTACEYELLDENPCQKINLDYKNLRGGYKEFKKERINYYNKQNYLKVLSLIKNENLDKRIIIEIALKTGLRKSEIFGLTWADVDFKRKIIRINKTRQYLKGKGLFINGTKNLSSIREIVVGNSIIELLKKYGENKSFKEDDFIIKNISFYGISEWFKKWQIKNNLPIIRFHDLRHTHATLLLALGVDIKTISKRLGHSSIVTTMNIYTHVLESLDKSAADKLEKLEIKKE